ncbi:MAG: MBL fold metallo-hydrolase [Candidatus Omnitrophica bacterium]|nr:MBL fold metallo-hydrolase [Candidatus Omnitrophota bacterium]
MDVYVLGSGVGVPSDRRTYPGLFVKTNTNAILIDPGPGSIRQLLRTGFHYNDVGVVILTHFHPDHCLDLVSLLFASRYPLQPRNKELCLIGATGLKRYYDGILQVFGEAVKPKGFRVDLEELEDGSLVLREDRISVKRLVHSDSAIGIRLTDSRGKILFYSGDTDYCENTVELAKGADLSVIECSFPDGGKVEGHLTPKFAGIIAERAGAKRLVLTHMYPVCDGYDIAKQCGREYTGEIIVAEDLLRVEV